MKQVSGAIPGQFVDVNDIDMLRVLRIRQRNDCEGVPVSDPVPQLRCGGSGTRVWSARAVA
jgi:hypothetical protein